MAVFFAPVFCSLDFTFAGGELGHGYDFLGFAVLGRDVFAPSDHTDMSPNDHLYVRGNWDSFFLKPCLEIDDDLVAGANG